MTTSVDTIEAARALKAKHRAMWALGDYATVARDVIPGLGAVLVDACRVRPGDSVLDIAAGPGNAAIPAALVGANVVACDLTPELLQAGRQQAAHASAVLEWRQADAEALPFADGEFDMVVSCVGVMFAPNHRASASEMIRVCRPPTASRPAGGPPPTSVPRSGPTPHRGALLRRRDADRSNADSRAAGGDQPVRGGPGTFGSCARCASTA